jgi:hypothetical protein
MACFARFLGSAFRRCSGFCFLGPFFLGLGTLTITVKPQKKTVDEELVALALPSSQKLDPECLRLVGQRCPTPSRTQERQRLASLAQLLNRFPTGIPIAISASSAFVSCLGLKGVVRGRYERF